MLSLELLHLDGYLGSMISKRSSAGYDILIDTIRTKIGGNSDDLKVAIISKYPILKDKWDDALEALSKK
jgi:hypothetical protein